MNKIIPLLIIVLGVGFWWIPISEIFSRPSKEARQDCSFAKRIIGNEAVDIEACHLDEDYRNNVVEKAHDLLSKWRLEQHDKRKVILEPTIDRAEFKRVHFSEMPMWSWEERGKDAPDRVVVEGFIAYSDPIDEYHQPTVSLYPFKADNSDFPYRSLSKAGITPIQLEFIETICPPDFSGGRNGLCEGDIYVEWIRRRGLLEMVMVGADLRVADREAYEATVRRYRELRATSRSRQ